MTTDSNWPPLDENNSTPLYIQLSEILADLVYSRKLQEGDRLPSENELLAQYPVSRNTVRLALERLVKLNLAVKKRGKGTFVSPKENRSLIPALIDFEEALKQHGIQVKNILTEVTPIDRLPAWATAGVAFDADRYVLMKRVKIMEKAPVALEERIMPAETFDHLKSENLEGVLVFEHLNRIPGFEITRFTYTLVAGTLSKEDEKLLNHKNAPVFKRIGFYFGRDGDPIMASRLTFASERLGMHYEFGKTGSTLEPGHPRLTNGFGPVRKHGNLANRD